MTFSRLSYMSIIFTSFLTSLSSPPRPPIGSKVICNLIFHQEFLHSHTICYSTSFLILAFYFNEIVPHCNFYFPNNSIEQFHVLIDYLYIFLTNLFRFCAHFNSLPVYCWYICRHFFYHRRKSFIRSGMCTANISIHTLSFSFSSTDKQKF